MKPSWIPPDWVYPPIWLVLYSLMGVSSYLIWKRYQQTKNVEIKNILYFYLVHLAVNASWLVVFMGGQQIGAGLAVIVVLLGMIAILISRFWKIDRAAALLLVPYLAWMMYATLLNTAVFFLNR